MQLKKNISMDFSKSPLYMNNISLIEAPDVIRLKCLICFRS